jgi:hypothetical protein
MMRLPIALMSFDRPDMIEPVLQSIVRQKPVEGVEFDYYLFQDGWVNRTDGSNKCDPDAARACVSIFKQYVPEGRAMVSQTNLGVAGNFDRAERTFFIENEYPAAFFFEDDMVLRPGYFETMVQLLKVAQTTPHIGMFSAYGHKVSTPHHVQVEKRDQICLMNEHNWAFGITRECWLARNELLKEYLEILGPIDYRDRKKFHPKIYALQRLLGRHGKGYHSSQDSMKNLACEALGYFRVTTFTNNAQYIGRTGEHMDESRFYARGYHNTVLYRGEQTPFEMPDTDRLYQLKTVPVTGF